ncbi:MAG: thiamine pyrophosphate-dependent dehydrogenase E1 component subunit alpha [Candidatus Omnitrophota bacterium]|nr:thiamine pyrophosphate-dependent dehydrogenase E1 component subunit alpha [Candidatus Omnitrophota bacterium]
MKKISSDCSNDMLLRLYSLVCKIRRVQLKIEKFYNKDEMKTPVHLCIGQEAIAAAVSVNLNKDDYVFSNHRGHGHYIAKGGNLKAMIAELHCKETGCSRGRGGSMHLIDTSVGLLGSSSIVGGGIPIAVGAAMGSVMQKEKRVTAVFFGDAASEEGVLYESMNFAALKKLPVVFICENNFYSVFSHQSARQATSDISMRPRAFGIPAYKVDGRDIISAYENSKKAVDAARSGAGPSFIECRAYRFRAHAGIGDDLKEKYRKMGEYDEWTQKCPVKDFENLLIDKGVLSKKAAEKIGQEISREIDEAFDFARKSPLPDKRELLKYLFG